MTITFKEGQELRLIAHDDFSMDQGLVLGEIVRVRRDTFIDPDDPYPWQGIPIIRENGYKNAYDYRCFERINRIQVIFQKGRLSFRGTK